MVTAVYERSGDRRHNMRAPISQKTWKNNQKNRMKIAEKYTKQYDEKNGIQKEGEGKRKSQINEIVFICKDRLRINTRGADRPTPTREQTARHKKVSIWKTEIEKSSFCYV